MKKAIVLGVSILFFTVCSYAASEFSDVGLDTNGGTECDVTDPFYADTCPTCTVKIIPKILGRLIGDKEDTRTFLILGPWGTQFDDDTVVKWESDSIEVLSRHIFFKRFMIMKAKINGSGLDKGAYRVLVGQCEGKIEWAVDNTQRCITANCLEEIIACQSDTECTGWLDCMQECGDDPMLCPTVCGAFYQSPEVNVFTQCALDNGCVEVDFSSLPPCNLPETKPVAVGNIDGFWWVSAIQGYDYVLYDDCQRFIFEELNETEISVENSTLVTYKDETRVVKNIGKYTRITNGYLELVYENWAGYSEQYYPFHVSPNVMVMHVCSVSSDNIPHDYGTLILTRAPLSSLDSAEMAEMETALGNVFQTTLEDFRLLRTSDCPNDAEAMLQDFRR
jgi:hypothetical protein